jgi:hypothetical protein
MLKHATTVVRRPALPPGVMPVSPLDDLRVDDWDEMIDINPPGATQWRQMHEREKCQSP